MEDFENYEVTSIIGSGSFGTCYKVKHKISSKEYVWKAVNYGEMSEEKKQLLVSEVNLLSKLRHPNIVKYYNHIIHRNSSTLYIIMEYCVGGDLFKIIRQCSNSSQHLDELFIWKILYQVSLALNVCHSQCSATVLHRDIKPANVFLDSENNIKLGDFGLAKILEEKKTFTDTLVGTPLYMSPELINNKKYNKKSDVWALGCLIYEACSLKPPFNGSSFKNLSAKIKNGKCNRIPSYYSDELQKMIDFMLNIACEQRPTVDILLRHPTVLLKANKPVINIFKPHKFAEPELQKSSCLNLESKFNENLQIQLDNIRNREAALKQKEEKLLEIERLLAKREKKIMVMERLANEKIARAHLYLKSSKENEFFNNKLQPKHKSYDDLDTTIYADLENSRILPTSAKIIKENIIRPACFVRSRSERKVQLNTKKVSGNSNGTVFKEYNFFNDNNRAIQDNEKNNKKHNFSMNVFKTLSSKRSHSNNSLGSKSSSNGSEMINNRPISWTEENKKCAFALLKMMNSDSNKENIHSNVAHTKM